MKTSIHILLASVAFTLSGCIIPVPHYSTRFQGVSGHVFDARTHRPITGVHVAVDEHPSASTTTDAGGAYRIQAQRNYHVLWAWFIMGDSYPSGEYWYPNLNFSHPGYRPVRWSGTFNEDAAEKAKNKPRPMNVWLDHTDVFLKPQ